MSPYLLYVLTRRNEPRSESVWIHSHIAKARYNNWVPFVTRPFHTER